MRHILFMLCVVGIYPSIMAQCTECPYVEFTYDQSGRRVMRETITPIPVISQPQEKKNPFDSVSTPNSSETAAVNIPSRVDSKKTKVTKDIVHDQNSPTLIKDINKKGFATNSKGDIFLYPVPATYSFSIYSKFIDFKETQLFMYDLTGRIVLKTTVNGSNTIDISLLPNAYYFVELTSPAGEKFIVKIIKQI